MVSLAFGDVSSAARDQDIIHADAYAASKDARLSVSNKRIKTLERSILEYSAAFAALSSYFISFGATAAHTMMSDFEANPPDPSTFPELDGTGFRTVLVKLIDALDFYVWLKDSYKGIDLRDYLLTLEDMTPEPRTQFLEIEGFLYHDLADCGPAIFEDGLPRFLPFYRFPRTERAAVILDPNGGKGTPAAHFITQDTETPLPENGFTRDGYTFAGWNTEPDGTADSSFEDKDPVRITSDLLLYAQWDPLPATAPSITGQPADVTLTYGYTSENLLTVTAEPASGHTIGAYQWYSGTPGDPKRSVISGASASAFTVPAGLGAGKYDYYCVVTAVRLDNQQTETATSAKATVTVSPATPAYTVPDGLRATYGQTLSDVTLPDGWTWDDPSAPVGDTGTRFFAATFTPEDAVNYASAGEALPVDVAKASVEEASLPDGEKPGVILTLSEEPGDQPLLSAPSRLPDGYVGVLYSTDGGETWSGDLPTCGTTGTYTVLVRYCGDANHEDLTFDPVTVTVVTAVYDLVSAADRDPVYACREHP
ncbi:MAG: InlB B-repeat-containing protein [Clostridia bacterium]|nr:InlB B-repeat-containing protein [Clostridia bacterium]